MTKLNRIMMLVVIAVFFINLGGCGTDGYDAGKENLLSTPEKVFALLKADGLTCEVTQAIECMKNDELNIFADLLSSSMTGDEFMTIAKDKEVGCKKIDSYVMALADYDDPWAGEDIEDDTIGGSSVQTTGWEIDPIGMCGPDMDDGIWEVNNLPYSFQYRTYLRYTGTDGFGNCVEALAGDFSSRVYTDNSIRMCVPSSRINICDNWYTPHDYSFTVGFE